MDHDLRALYQQAIAEDRFQVQLNWDRTKFSLTLNGSIYAAGIALGALSASDLAHALALVVFLAGAVATGFGIKAAREGKVYHRAALVKKALYAGALGLDAAAPGTVPSQYGDLSIGALPAAKRSALLADPDRHVTAAIEPGSVTGAIVLLLVALLLLDLVSAGWAITLLLHG